jgi:hypothetical protein
LPDRLLIASLPDEDVRKMVTERTSLPLRTSHDRGGRNIILDGLKDDRLVYSRRT